MTFFVFVLCMCAVFFKTHLIPAIVSPLPRPGLDPILDSFTLLSPAMSHLVASDVRSVISLDFVPRRDPPSYSFEFEGLPRLSQGLERLSLLSYCTDDQHDGWVTPCYSFD
jgi:hypothetical protein